MKILRRLLGLIGPGVKFEVALDSVIPKRGSKEAAALDIYANESVLIEAGDTEKIPTGIKSSFHPGWAACLWDRSGLGAKGLHRYAGLIDSDYRGEWNVVLHNSTVEDVVINKGDRVAQVVFQRVWIGKPRQGRVKVDTKRGTGGFGSTGK